MTNVKGTLLAPKHSAAPASPVRSQIYYDNDDDTLYYWNGTKWVGGAGQAPGGPASGDLSGTYPDPVVHAASDGLVVSGGDLILKGALLEDPDYGGGMWLQSGYDLQLTDGSGIFIGTGGDFQIQANAGSGKILTSDGIGKGTWADPPAGSSAEVHIATSQPSPRVGQLLWVDTDDPGAPSTTVGIEAWHTVGAAGEPAYQNSWIAHSATYAARFRKRPDGLVELDGMIRGGTLAQPAFTLPVGYRPDPTLYSGGDALYLPAIASGKHTAYVTINMNGDVRVEQSSGSTVVVGDWISLQGIQFSTVQTTFPAGMPSGAPTLVTVLPSGPADGQEVYYLADATNGVVWHLRYRQASSSAYKWEFLGGSELLGELDSQHSTASTSYVALSGPSVTIPLAGEYEACYGFQGMLHSASSGGAATAVPFVNGVQQGRAVNAVAFGSVGVDGTYWASVVSEDRLSVSIAGHVMELRYRAVNVGAGAGTAYFNVRFLSVRPVRVG